MKVFVLAGLVACALAGGDHPGGHHAAILFKVNLNLARRLGFYRKSIELLRERILLIPVLDEVFADIRPFIGSILE